MELGAGYGGSATIAAVVLTLGCALIEVAEYAVSGDDQYRRVLKRSTLADQKLVGRTYS